MKKKTVIIQCGLGNQLFQYAYMNYLKMKGFVVKYNLSYYLRKKVHDGFVADRIVDFCSFKTDNHDYYTKFGIFWEKMFTNRYAKLLKLDHLWRVEKGYWFDAKYYDEVKDVIFSRVCDLDNLYTGPKELIEKISSPGTVFLHIRRGDYLKHQDLFFNLCDNSNYYESALTLLSESGLETEKVYVFSDDMAFCKHFLSRWTTLNYVEYENSCSINDFILMSKCENAIVSNSTFSWWAAAISPKKNVFRPSAFYGKGFANANDQSMWPKYWICVDANPSKSVMKSGNI